MKIPECLDQVLGVLFPPVCHVCGHTLSPGERFICSSCRVSLPRTGYHRIADNAMERRFMGRFPFKNASGHFFYSKGSSVAELIHDFKYRGYPALARELGRIVGAELLSTPFLAGIDIILPVPLHWRKRLVRGYNQSWHFATGLSDITGIPVGDNLRALRYHRTQTSLTREERFLNTCGSFRVCDAPSLSGRGVLVVDDVCTTGATLSSVGETLAAEVPDLNLSLLTLGVTF